ncbi:MAG: stage V sporulation protein AA [Defluviitaleaceae bacterium]|nr:stage V sporulation protein AA [Defluviitaleaceae bacterium]
MDIYIKLKKKSDLKDSHEILIGDVADVVAPSDSLVKINMMKLKSTDKGKGTKNYLIGVTDVIKRIGKDFPNATINNVGETDTWVHCVNGKRKDKPFLIWLRVAAVSVILMVGAATAIMSFHTDGQVSKVFENYHRMIYGETQSNPPLMVISYSVGLAVGIFIFYNHFLGRKLTDDPTPIEVEIETYEKEITEAMVDMMERRERKND